MMADCYLIIRAPWLHFELCHSSTWLLKLLRWNVGQRGVGNKVKSLLLFSGTLIAMIPAMRIR